MKLLSNEKHRAQKWQMIPKIAVKKTPKSENVKFWKQSRQRRVNKQQAGTGVRGRPTRPPRRWTSHSEVQPLLSVQSNSLKTESFRNDAHPHWKLFWTYEIYMCDPNVFFSNCWVIFKILVTLTHWLQCSFRLKYKLSTILKILTGNYILLHRVPNFHW